MTQLLLAFVAASALSTAAMAATAPPGASQDPSSAPAATKTAVGKPKVICRAEDTTGSRLGGHRECHTEAEWRAMVQENSSYLSSIRNHSSGQYFQSGGGGS